jgi:hypothetical protein
MCKNMAETERSRMAVIQRMRFACWITKATDTHAEYELLIAFTRQQCLRERAGMLRLYVRCLSCYPFMYSVQSTFLKTKMSRTWSRCELEFAGSYESSVFVSCESLGNSVGNAKEDGEQDMNSTDGTLTTNRYLFEKWKGGGGAGVEMEEKKCRRNERRGSNVRESFLCLTSSRWASFNIK